MTKQQLQDLNGSYFSANYNGEKFRGIINDDQWGNVRFCNKTFGEDTDDCGDDTEGFPKYVDVYVDTTDVTLSDFKEELERIGITDLKIINDDRQKKVIDRDRLPEINNYVVTSNDGGKTLVFGCGEVELEKKEIEDYLDVKKEIKNSQKYQNYLNVLKAIEDRGDDEEYYPDEEVEALLKYFS